MILAFFYGCLRLLLDIADIRLRVRNPEAELLLLRHELRVLRRQVKRPALRPADRAIMAAFHRLVQRQALGGLVQPETILGWHRDLVRKKWATFAKRRGVGRPRLDIKLREQILRMARENSNWGCIRIRELMKLGQRVSATAIRNLLRRQGLGPAPSRSRLSWQTFLRAQASTIVLSDFFSVDTILLRRLYVLLYMELATRRILLARCTDQPNEFWVAQQARNLSWRLEDGGIKLGFLIHDHDKRFTRQADEVLKSGGGRVIVTRLLAPRANAHMERQIGSGRRECFDWILILGRRHLERVTGEWIAHYNQARPHRGWDLRTPIARSDPVDATAPVHCRTRLGGLLRDYSRRPARVAA